MTAEGFWRAVAQAARLVMEYAEERLERTQPADLVARIRSVWKVE